MSNTPARPPAPGLRDENRMGNTVLTVSGYFKRGTTGTAVDKMTKVLDAESRCQHPPVSDPLPVHPQQGPT